MDTEAKSKLATKLTHALHQAPNHPENFATVVRQLLNSAGLHITDLSVTIGDLHTRMAEQLRAARADAPPSFDNLVDIAGAKIPLGRNPERALAKALGVSVKHVEACKHGRVPRSWLDKIRNLPEVDETHAKLDAETARVAKLLAAEGLPPEQIYNVFQKIRVSRAGLKQIANAVHGPEGPLTAQELADMREGLFNDMPDADDAFVVWLSAHTRTKMAALDEFPRAFNLGQVEKLRARYKRELELRRGDPNYRRVATAADRIERPLKRAAATGSTDPTGDARRLRSEVAALFGDNADRCVIRFTQLTGLDDKHAADLLGGAARINKCWWDFLAEVRQKVFPTDELPLLRSINGGAAAQELVGQASP